MRNKESRIVRSVRTRKVLQRLSLKQLRTSYPHFVLKVPILRGFSESCSIPQSPGDRKTAEHFTLLFTASAQLNKAQFSQIFLRAVGNLYKHLQASHRLV